MHVEFAIHKEHVVALLAGTPDVGVVAVGVLRVEDDEIAILVGLRVFDEVFVLVKRVVLAIEIAEEGEGCSPVVELLVGEHAELNEELDVVPLLLIVGALVLEELLQFVGHLLGDVAADLLDGSIALQIAAADIEGNVGRVDDTMQKGEVFGHDVVHLVGDKDLVAVELDLVAPHVEVVLYLREIEDAREVERIVHIEVDMEEGFVELHGIEFVVELGIVLFGEFGGLAGPCRLRIVDDILFARFLLAAVFPLLLHAKDNLNREEVAVFGEQLLNLAILEILFVLVVDMENDVGTAFGLDGRFHLIDGAAVARPMDSLGPVFIAERENLHALGDHEGGIEAQAEVADNGGGVVLVLLNELLGTGEGNLVDVAVHLFGCHADAVVGDSECLFLLVDEDAYTKVAEFAFGIAHRGEGLELLRGIDGVADEFAQEYLMVAVEELFDDGEDVV